MESPAKKEQVSETTSDDIEGQGLIGAQIKFLDEDFEIVGTKCFFRNHRSKVFKLHDIHFLDIKFVSKAYASTIYTDKELSALNIDDQSDDTDFTCIKLEFSTRSEKNVTKRYFTSDVDCLKVYKFDNVVVSFCSFDEYLECYNRWKGERYFSSDSSCSDCSSEPSSFSSEEEEEGEFSEEEDEEGGSEGEEEVDDDVVFEDEHESP